MKAYEVITSKECKIVLGSSIKQVKEFVENNRREFKFDMSGSFKVEIDHDIDLNSLKNIDKEEYFVDVKSNLFGDVEVINTLA